MQWLALQMGTLEHVDIGMGVRCSSAGNLLLFINVMEEATKDGQRNGP